MILPVTGRITVRHGQWLSTSFYRGSHKGYDFAVNTNTPVKSTSPGKVTFRGWHWQYGNVIYVKHGTLEVRYAHLNGFAVRLGATVKEGQVIAYSGNTGWSTGPHLHWEALVSGRNVDPIAYRIPRPSGTFWVRVDKAQAAVRSGATSKHPLAGSRMLRRGQRFEATGSVRGERIMGNDIWWVSKVGNKVWSGGTTRQ